MTRSKAFQRGRARIVFGWLGSMLAGAAVMTVGTYYCLGVHRIGKSLGFFFAVALGREVYELLSEQIGIRADERRQRKFYERFPIPW